MRKLALMLAALLLSVAVAQAADVPTTAGTREMVFIFNGLSDLGISGYSGGIGCRWFLKDDLALRPGVSFGWSRMRVRPDQRPHDEPTPTDSREIDTSVGIDIALERHVKGPMSISPYLGASVRGFYMNDKTYPSYLAGAPPGTVTKITRKETDGGLFGILGFEWGCTESLTLGGETSFGLKVTTGKKETEAIDTPDRLSDDRAGLDFGFRTSAIYLGVRW